MKTHMIRFTAKVMLIVMIFQLVVPATSSFALTTGPSQPEVQSFEPVGTTEMVDLFSGDFVYNIPLMDVEGYPINISYHSGITMEQESSWVGLGWNINPGEIGRGMRGVPDDYNGDYICKNLKVKDETEWRLRGGISAKPELFGAPVIKGGLDIGIGVTFNNYRGTGVSVDASVNARMMTPVSPQIGMGVSVGSLDGATVDANAGLTLATGKVINESSGSISLSASTGFNTRRGLKDIGLGWNVAFSNDMASLGKGGQSSIPIGLQNYVSVITNASTVKSWSFSLKLGPELLGGFLAFSGKLGRTITSYDTFGTRPAYGYLYAQNAGDSAIMDFSREKDGMYNNTMPNLPLSNMTYDVYSITGQGTGGVFRPFRNDFGSVFDPIVKSSTKDKSVSVEGGLGGAYEVGGSLTTFENEIKSGPWFRRAFSKSSPGSLYENFFFKQAGEMTYSQEQDYAPVSGHSPVAVNSAGNKFTAKGGSVLPGNIPASYSTSNRSSRANMLSFLTNGESELSAIGNLAKRESYQRNSFSNGTAAATNITKIERIGTTVDKAKRHHIGEMMQVLPDGRRYVYGLPAMNNYQKDVTFAVNSNNANISTGLVPFNDVDESKGNGQGIDNYYQSTYTPAYAHSYLLTSVLSPDYTDITGDGVSEDDLGSYTKLTYTRTDPDFRWIAPIQAAASDLNSANPNYAQYNPGYWSDPKDDKGNYTMGSREMWYMHSVESKNMIAEFYISPRLDGRGVLKKIAQTGDNSGTVDPLMRNPKPTNSPSESYKLDSIKLYNRHERITNPNGAVPVKTVIFVYDYSLCPGTPNSTASGGGKLTLRRIFFRYGNSDKSLLNPYEFNYDQANNKPYSFANKDRWGNYKDAETSELTNYEFPYVKQDTAAANANAANWHLTGIKLPSGGNLKVSYEADDYSYVQDKRTMEMFRDVSVGAGKAYLPKDVLYEDIAKQYDYIYFNRAKNREISGKSPKENYLQNEDMVYFSFSVDLAAKAKYENIKGYAKVEDIGYCSDSLHGYIRVQKESAGLKSQEKINPVTLATLNTGRLYLPHIIYPGYNTGDPIQILKALAAAGGELIDITKNANVVFVGKGFGKRFKTGKSWIRLNTPGYTKVGGGTRVRSLKIEDGWNDMVSGGLLSEYGQNYKYTTLLDNNREISSGVASYEPLVGGDEIPQHRPANKYTADGGRLLPAIEFNQEEPFGESFYPSPQVGYSKVTVTSINLNKGNMDVRSAKNMNIQEFYTAKDFPIKTDFTEKSVPVNQQDYGLFNRFEEVNVLQGYVLRMNDMHGKPKAVSNYVIKTSPGSTEGSYELITSTKYNYQTQDGELYNKVKAVKRGPLVRQTYSNYTISDMLLGEEADLTIDNRMREMDSKNFNIDANVNVIGLAFISIPIPSVFFPDTHEKSIFKTMVSTKVIQQYGILKSVETVDHGARVLTENVLYDSETGQVLLTRVNNEYNDLISNLSLPAFWAYDNMGPAYYNIGYEEILDSIYVDADGKGYLLDVVDRRNFNLGDELMIRIPSGVGNEAKVYRVWVTDMKTPPVPFVPLPTAPGCPCGSTPHVEDSMVAGDGYDKRLYCDGGTWCFYCKQTDNSYKYWIRTGSTWTEVSNLNSHPAPPQPSTTPSGYGTPAFNGCQWISYSNSSSTTGGAMYWVGNQWQGPYAAGPQVPPPPPTSYCSDPTNVPVIEPRSKIVFGTGLPWITFQKGYSGVYIKVIRSGRRNMLGSTLQNLAIKGNFAPVTFTDLLSPPSTAILSASATLYTDEAYANDLTGAASYGFNDYVLGKLGNFREEINAAYLKDRNNSGHNRSSGVFNSFQNCVFQFTDDRLCSFSDVLVYPMIANWKTLKTVTRYSVFGLPLEEKDPAGIYSTALYGYNHSLPIAVGTNIRYGALKYFNFEDLLQVQQQNKIQLGIWEMLAPITIPSGTTYRDGLGYKTYLSSYFGGGLEVRSNQSHTGKYSMLFTDATKIKLTNTSELQSGYGYISMWVKPNSGTLSTTGMFIQGYGKPTIANASEDFTAFSVKTNSIDGWYKLEGKLDLSLLTPYQEVYLKMPAGYYVDDIRLYPDAGNMKSFAYDVSTMRLMAELDENNFATFYEYDQEGVLIRVKKESDRGILTVSENRKSNAKKVQ